MSANLNGFDTLAVMLTSNKADQLIYVAKYFGLLVDQFTRGPYFLTTSIVRTSELELCEFNEVYHRYVRDARRLGNRYAVACEFKLRK